MIRPLVDSTSSEDEDPGSLVGTLPVLPVQRYRNFVVEQDRPEDWTTDPGAQAYYEFKAEQLGDALAREARDHGVTICLPHAVDRFAAGVCSRPPAPRTWTCSGMFFDGLQEGLHLLQQWVESRVEQVLQGAAEVGAQVSLALEDEEKSSGSKRKRP
jgi:hypothetical protein